VYDLLVGKVPRFADTFSHNLQRGGTMLGLFLVLLIVLAIGGTAIVLVRMHNLRPDVVARREEAVRKDRELERKKERDGIRGARRHAEHAAATARLQAQHHEEEARRLKEVEAAIETEPEEEEETP